MPDIATGETLHGLAVCNEVLFRFKMNTDDLSLLHVGMTWIKLFLFGIQVDEVKLKK